MELVVINILHLSSTNKRMDKYLLKVNNKDTTTTCTNVILKCLLLTLNKYLFTRSGHSLCNRRQLKECFDCSI